MELGERRVAWDQAQQNTDLEEAMELKTNLYLKARRTWSRGGVGLKTKLYLKARRT